MEVGRRLPGADGAVVDATWSGTDAATGNVTTLACVFAFEVDDVTGTITRLRGHYERPG